MPQPTILQIVPELDTGGAELSAVEIGEAVHRAGWRSIIVTEGGRLEADARDQGSEIHKLSVATKNPVKMWANVSRLAQLCKRENVCLLHARSRAPAWSAFWAARRLGLPFVTTYHGAYNEKGRAKRLYNSVMARGDRVIANSQFTADLIRQRYDTPHEKITVIHRGVDRSFDRDLVSKERLEAVRRRWGLGADEIIILQAARLTGWKGQQVLIEAAGRAQSAGLADNVRFVIAGDAQNRTSYLERLKAQIAQLGLSEKVLLVGHESDMAAAFAAAYAVVVASTEPEAFGRVGAEAQALGRPVIATRLGAPQETVRSEPEFGPTEVTGWLVKPGDADEMAAAIGAVLALDEAAYSAMADRAIQNAHSNFTLEQMKRLTLAVYDDLLGSRLEKAFKSAVDTSISSHNA
ncbi:MAG: glycosyltransferase family 4 protein [Pseudomonadota bacterium]